MKLFKKSEIAVILVLLIFASLFLIYNYYQNSKITDIKAIIIYNSDIVYEYSLDRDMEFSIEELPNVVFEIRQGAIGFIHSDCPDKVCIHSGMLNMAGQTAACLPNKVILSIQGESEIDLIIG